MIYDGFYFNISAKQYNVYQLSNTQSIICITALSLLSKKKKNKFEKYTKKTKAKEVTAMTFTGIKVSRLVRFLCYWFKFLFEYLFQF